MKILIEDEDYPIELLTGLFDDDRSLFTDYKIFGRLKYVGFYHSALKKEFIIILPKVFMKGNNKTVFDINLLELLNDSAVFYSNNIRWLNDFSIFYYKCLIEYKRRSTNTNLLNENLSFNIKTNIQNFEYSYLQIILQIINTFKKSEYQLFFKNTMLRKASYKNINWNKTIRKEIPIILNRKTAFYPDFSISKKTKNNDEDLLIYFLSIVNYINEEYKFNLKIDNYFPLILKERFDKFINNGITQLKKLKYKYYSDVHKHLYYLCEQFLLKTNESGKGKNKNEFLLVSNFNLLFEDMIDKLVSDSLDNNNNIIYKNLKFHKDGKIVDHIFEFKSLIDNNTNIYYIGDSKYYKTLNFASEQSKYKQITYAKNIIQYNIDLQKKGTLKESLKYRDDLTEGYDITPNFFMYGYIRNFKDFDSPSIKVKTDIFESTHFNQRLFDRDTLFVHQYKINFLFVLKAYTAMPQTRIKDFKIEIHNQIRNNFINYFNSSSKYKFFQTDESLYIKEIIKKDFYRLNGKIIKISNSKIILAKHIYDTSIDDILHNFTEYLLS